MIARAAAAQEVAITNARIIVGSGQVIESGAIVVRGGRIVSVSAGTAPTQGLPTIDAKGNGSAKATVPAVFADTSTYYVNLHDAAAAMSIIVACGDLAKR